MHAKPSGLRGAQVENLWSRVLPEVIDNFLSVFSILCLETNHDPTHVSPYCHLKFLIHFSCTFLYTLSSRVTDNSAANSCLPYHL